MIFFECIFVDQIQSCNFKIVKLSVQYNTHTYTRARNIHITSAVTIIILNKQVASFAYFYPRVYLLHGLLESKKYFDYKPILKYIFNEIAPIL